VSRRKIKSTLSKKVIFQPEIKLLNGLVSFERVSGILSRPVGYSLLLQQAQHLHTATAHCFAVSVSLFTSNKNTKKVLLFTTPLALERKLMKPGPRDLDTGREKEV
jgi:hypothetical protein